MLKRQLFTSLSDARRKIEEWRQDYNQQRPHSSLGYLSPAAFARTRAEMTMRKASTWMLEKGIQTPSPSPDLIPAGNNKTLAENLHGNWNIKRGHFTLERYNQILPGAAERIIAMAESQHAHRQGLEKHVIESNVSAQRLGTILGFVVAMTAISWRDLAARMQQAGPRCSHH